MMESGEQQQQQQQQSKNDSVETVRAERSVWLMKCPVGVSKSWKSAVHNQPLSKVIVSLDPLSPQLPSSLQFTMEMMNDDVEESGRNMPRSYSLNMFNDFVPMAVFSEINQGKVAIEGKVEHKFDMKPHNKNMEEYSKMCRDRTQKSMIKTRQTKVLDDRVPQLPGLNIIINKEKRKVQPLKGPDVKRTRRDRGELEDIMFKLFERQPNWTLKHLIQETDQPAQFLKEILNELCVYNKRGSNQGTYELKPEYKKTVEDTGAE